MRSFICAALIRAAKAFDAIACFCLDCADAVHFKCTIEEIRRGRK